LRILTQGIRTANRGGNKTMRYSFRSLSQGLRLLASGFIALGLLSATSKVAESQSEMVKLDAYWGAFQVGGEYTTIPGLNSGNPPTDEQASLVMDGAMYVNYVIPYTVTHRYPIVLIHGGVGTGQAFLSTPDGRTGWPSTWLRRALRCMSSISPHVDGRFTSSRSMGR
jgi:hypothetical protein